MYGMSSRKVKRKKMFKALRVYGNHLPASVLSFLKPRKMAVALPLRIASMWELEALL